MMEFHLADPFAGVIGLFWLCFMFPGHCGMAGHRVVETVLVELLCSGKERWTFVQCRGGG